MDRNDDDRIEGRLNGDQPEARRDGMGMRLLYMFIIWIMLSLSQTVLTLITVVQFVIMLVNTGERNQRLADFGTDLGIWMAKAARYQSAASEVKPWPWTDLD
jgi:succinate-acetate transporter protein